MITLEQIKEICPNAKQDIAEAIANNYDLLSEYYEINTPLRLAHFLAQCAHESGGFRLMQENLNYSADGLNKIFPKYFKIAGRNAEEYAKKPAKIANLVYANRMGNGDSATGDGWNYCGRGLIQLTGKNNYSSLAETLEMTIDEAVEYIQTAGGALESAAWFWANNGCNELADTDDIVRVTKKVNGGTIGLEDRKEHLESFKEALGID
jgi:putative chitinase